MKKRVAVVTVELLLEPGSTGIDLTEAIEHVSSALEGHKLKGNSFLRYADHNVIDARIIRER